MKTEAKTGAKLEDGLSADEDRDSGKDALLEALMETTDEISQVEELRKHAQKLKEDMIRYFTEVLRKYQLELSIPASSINPTPGFVKDNVKFINLNESGVVSYSFADGTLKSQRLEDYQPVELMGVLGVIMPHLKDALKSKRKEYERVSNRLTKIGKYLGLFKDKLAVKSDQDIWSSNNQ